MTSSCYHRIAELPSALNSQGEKLSDLAVSRDEYADTLVLEVLLFET